MPKLRKDQSLLPSVLDRLLDDEPEKKVELPKSAPQLLRDLANSVRRDLENLLNTRWRCTVWPPDLSELDSSLVNYGLPDFSGVNMGLSSERETLRNVIERVIAIFEPRLKKVQVRMLQNDDSLDRILRFRIDALLMAEPTPQKIVFDSQLEPTTASFEIKSH